MTPGRDISPAFSVLIEGYEEIQRGLTQTVRAIQPASGLGRGVKEALLMLHRYSISVTHVDTGTLRASHLPEFDAANAEGRISISDTNRNPRSGQPPSVYGPVEHARGDFHAFYARTLSERGDAAGDLGMQIIMRELP